MRCSEPWNLVGMVGWSLVALALATEANAASRFPWSQYSRRGDEWYLSDEGQRITANVLSWQSPRGSWPKNLDTSAEPYQGDRADLKGTFDNGATIGELRFLARAYRANRRPEPRDAFLKGLDHILDAQYANGGWPQFFPPGTGYQRYITFNDGTMVALMEFLRDVARSDDFAFVDAPRRAAALKAFDKGIDCILRCQVKVGNNLTVWCAQHDESTFEPRPARSFEPASLSGGESAGILRLLMSLDDPSPEVAQAIECGARWYDSVRLDGIKQVTVNGDKKIVPDPKAPPLWARFYEIGTNRPIFCGRDSILHYDIAEIEPERRNGYAWYGTWGRGVAESYRKWAARHAKPGKPSPAPAKPSDPNPPREAKP